MSQSRQIASSLPPLDVTRAPEGGEIGPVQTGWRLALREFARNKLAVAGLGILLFFLLFCLLGPIFYHGNVLNTNLASTDLPPGAGHPIGTTDVGFDELALLMKGGQAALEVGFFAAALRARFGEIPRILLTADHSDAAREAITGRGYPLLYKPVRPAALRALLSRVVQLAQQPAQ